jgi:puromycin-sensitive aminopeptidase
LIARTKKVDRMPGCDHSHKKLTLEDVLLPKHTKPIRYDIHLTPDLVACTFTGSETIEIEVSAETSTLILHAHELTIVPETVKLSGGPSKVAIEKISYDLTARQQVSLQFDGKIAPGNYKLSCEFKGVLNDQLAGFYRSKDKPFPGKEEWMAVCQFEATDARRCFPCFDEPALKAVFGITVTAPADRTAISNGSVTRVDTSPCGTKKTWHFEESPVMSSYLVCVVVGRFDHVSQMGNNGVLTSVYVPVGKADLGKFALKVGVEALEFFERKFKVPYFGGKKLDHIAIPDVSSKSSRGALRRKPSRRPLICLSFLYVIAVRGRSHGEYWLCHLSSGCSYDR